MGGGRSEARPIGNATARRNQGLESVRGSTSGRGNHPIQLWERMDGVERMEEVVEANKVRTRIVYGMVQAADGRVYKEAEVMREEMRK